MEDKCVIKCLPALNRDTYLLVTSYISLGQAKRKMFEIHSIYYIPTKRYNFGK